ncbi:MAG: tRNA (guanosine(46)-N7)-methyltransferase TrmB [Peptoniphilaceae bacterium]
MRLRKKHFAIPEMEENPYVYFEGEKYLGSWKKVFGNGNEIHVEIGSGKGAFIEKLSQKNKNINYVMIEQESNAFVYATRKILDSELDNVRALPINAENIDKYFDENEISRIYINFCNPWPKNRQHKRRLTHPRFLSKYKKVLKEGSKIYLKTDDQDFFSDTLEYIRENNIDIIEHTRDMKLEDYPENIITEYEKKWRSQNKPICYGELQIKKRG